jgi:hypothetical protein
MEMGFLRLLTRGMPVIHKASLRAQRLRTEHKETGSQANLLLLGGLEESLLWGRAPRNGRLPFPILLSLDHLQAIAGNLGVIKTGECARHQWLSPVILATQEAEIRRIAVRSQPQANSS